MSMSEGLDLGAFRRRRPMHVAGWSGERPVTRDVFVAELMRETAALGGEAPATWRLPFDCARELANDISELGDDGRVDDGGLRTLPPTPGATLTDMRGAGVMFMGVTVVADSETDFHPDGAHQELGAPRQRPSFNPPTELRPPPEHEGNLVHFLQHPMMVARGMETDIEAAAWNGEAWLLLGDDRLWTPEDLAAAGWRYLGPAVWSLPLYAERFQATRIAELEAAIQTGYVLDIERQRLARMTTARLAELEAEVTDWRKRHPSERPLGVRNAMRLPIADPEGSPDSLLGAEIDRTNPLDQHEARVGCNAGCQGFGEAEAQPTVQTKVAAPTAKALPGHVFRR